MDLHCTQRVTFIENKTNYTAYLVSEMQPGELVVYHGGFLSAQKRRLFGMIAGAAPPETQLRFWADIDHFWDAYSYSLEEIRRMLAGTHTVGDGMRRHLVTLEREKRNLDQAAALRFRETTVPLT